MDSWHLKLTAEYCLTHRNVMMRMHVVSYSPSFWFLNHSHCRSQGTIFTFVLEKSLVALKVQIDQLSVCSEPIDMDFDKLLL